MFQGVNKMKFVRACQGLLPFCGQWWNSSRTFPQGPFCLLRSAGQIQQQPSCFLPSFPGRYYSSHSSLSVKHDVQIASKTASTHSALLHPPSELHRQLFPSYTHTLNLKFCSHRFFISEHHSWHFYYSNPTVTFHTESFVFIFSVWLP